MICSSLRLNFNNFQKNRVKTIKLLSSNMKSDSFEDTPEYIITEHNDTIMRQVKPYIQHFKTFAKGRWLGRELMEVLTREYGGHPKGYWEEAIANGRVKVNDNIVTGTYKYKNNDKFFHKTHRHEPPVMGKISLVADTEEIMAVSKPPSLPMHASGAYRFNTLEYILKYEPLIKDQPQLHIIHRLDRVTSGLVILAKTKERAAKLSEQIRTKDTKKVYLARVKGKFPANVSYLKKIEKIDLYDFQDERYISVKKRNLSNKNDQNPKKKQRKDSKYGLGKDINISDLPPIREIAPDFEEVGKFENVGFLYTSNDIDHNTRYLIDENGKTNVENNIKTEETDNKSLNVATVVENEVKEKFLWLSCPVGPICQRDGLHACDPRPERAGRPSLSSFRRLAYCPHTDTTLLECNPYTGRTHQLRLHLQFLGCPIANDPGYGGELFYGEEWRRKQAIESLQQLKKEGLKPLSKIPHLLLSEEEKTELLLENEKTEESKEVQHILCSDEIKSDNGYLIQNEGENDEDYIIRTCRFCRDGKSGMSEKLERVLHCDGIWLHAHRYSRRLKTEVKKDSSVGDGDKKDEKDEGNISEEWDFTAPYPNWASEMLENPDSTVFLNE